MDDLISRAAAIRWVKTECNPYGNPTLDFESGKKVIEHLEQMPSAQPEERTEKRTETHACDLISRQAAKLKVARVIWKDGDSCNDFHDKCVDCLDDVPPVQPEPISEEYAKAVRTWLINYQVRCAELMGRYTPYEILGWIVSDWRKENEIW